MELSELTKYAEEKYHIEEEFKWSDFPGFSVLCHPQTGKWVALLMRQWDSETGTELQRCDIKCGKQGILGFRASYLGNAYRMKGEKWVGVRFERNTDPKVVFELFDRAVSIERKRGFQIVLDNTQKNSKDSFSDTLIPLQGLRGNYRKKPGPSANTGRIQSEIPPRFIEMMEMYDYSDNSFEGKCRNFFRQGKFMEDYEDDAPWDKEFYRYFTTYHDLNYLQLRGYFAWRTKVRRGEFHQIATSLAYIYIYELLNGIGADSPADSLRKMKEFEAGYLDSGIGEGTMLENLHRWEMEFAVLKNLPKEQVLPFINASLLKRDRRLAILQKPQNFGDEEIFDALSGLTGDKILKSPVITRHGDRGKHLFAEVWKFMSEHYQVDGWDLFTACFGKIRKYPWHPLANAIYLHDSDCPETEYALNECRKFVYRNGAWSEERFDNLFFDKYRIHAVARETDRMLRLYLKTGHPLKEKPEENWSTPYVHAVIEIDKKAELEAAKPKITIDLSGLDRIRRDSLHTRDSLLTEEEMDNSEEKVLSIPSMPDPADRKAENAETIQKSINIPLDPMQIRILQTLVKDGNADQLINENHLIPSVVTDAINEALFDEIGDSVLEYNGSIISIVEDYKEDIINMLGGNN